MFEKIAKLDPQPDENGIFSIALTNECHIGEDGRFLEDEDGCLYKKRTKDSKSVAGAVLSEVVDDGLVQGRFSRCPVEENEHVKLLTGEITYQEIDGEYWWVRKKNP